jgi:hypothetical protein
MQREDRAAGRCCEAGFLDSTREIATNKRSMTRTHGGQSSDAGHWLKLIQFNGVWAIKWSQEEKSCRLPLSGGSPPLIFSRWGWASAPRRAPNAIRHTTTLRRPRSTPGTCQIAIPPRPSKTLPSENAQSLARLRANHSGNRNEPVPLLIFTISWYATTPKSVAETAVLCDNRLVFYSPWLSAPPLSARIRPNKPLWYPWKACHATSIRVCQAADYPPNMTAQARG